MKFRGLILAVVILAALTGTLYWSNHHKPSSTLQASTDLPPKLLTLKQADIDKVEIQKKDSPAIVLAKQSGDQWQITAPESLPADHTAVTDILSTLSSLGSDRLVEDKASDLSQYGLSAPSLEVQVTEKGNKTQKLLLGDDTPTNSAVFAKLDGDPRIFTLARYSENSFNKGVNDLRDKRLITAKSTDVKQVDLDTKQQDIEFGREKDEWQILKPRPLRADKFQVDNLLTKLTDARMDLTSNTDPRKIAAAFASGTPVATAKLVTDSGSQELQVRKNKGDYYAKSSAVQGVYKVSSDLGQSLDKRLDDFRNKKLFDFGDNGPDKVELHDGAKAYFFTKGGEDWWNGNGKKLDTFSADSLIDKVRDLQASKFVDSGFSSPLVSITVTSNGGKRVEKVLISENGKNYIAKRESEPALYALDANAVDDLLKSAGDVKPAAPEPKK
jgi:Domain of unknown function (DUF4340)